MSCDLNHRLAISEASVGRHIALRESTPTMASFRLDEDFRSGSAFGSLLTSVRRNEYALLPQFNACEYFKHFCL